jgi:hypothetical protein
MYPMCIMLIHVVCEKLYEANTITRRLLPIRSSISLRVYIWTIISVSNKGECTAVVSYNRLHCTSHFCISLFMHALPATRLLGSLDQYSAAACDQQPCGSFLKVCMSLIFIVCQLLFTDWSNVIASFCFSRVVMKHGS